MREVGPAWPASEGVLQAQNGNGLVEVLDDLEALLAEEGEPVLDAVFGTHTHVGTAMTLIDVSKNAAVVLVVGIGEAQKRVDGEGAAGGDDVVQVDIGVDGAHAVVLEVVHELGGDAESVDGFDLQLQAEACHGVLGRIGELCAYGDVAFLGAGTEGGNEGQNGQKDNFFHFLEIVSSP